MVALLQVRKVRHSPAIYLTNCVLGKGGGGEESLLPPPGSWLELLEHVI